MQLEDNKQLLLNNARDPNKLRNIRERLGKDYGRIFQGQLPSYEWSQEFLGDTYGKVILASKGIETLGKDKNTSFTALGGWCAIRTKCLREIGKGVLTNPISGKQVKIRSVAQVAQWIQNAISADQIIETIGIYQGTNYAAISEVKLWTKKLTNTLELFLNRELTDDEKQTTYNAIAKAEEKRYAITKKYLEYLNSKPISLVRVIDADIYDDLVKERDVLFEKIGITIDDLVEPMIRRILKSADVELRIGTKTRKDLLDYINSSSLVWFMYTGSYLSILKKKKYVTTSKGVIIEPWSHAISNESEAKFNSLVFTNNNSYLYPNSVNEDLAYVAIDEVSSYNWKNSKNTVSISGVPNIHNYSLFLEKLDEDESISYLDLSKNKSFMYGFNYLPYGKCKNALLNMVQIRDEYRNKKKQFKNIYKEDMDIRAKVEPLRNKYSLYIKEQSKTVNKELLGFFKFIFKQ